MCCSGSRWFGSCLLWAGWPFARQGTCPSWAAENKTPWLPGWLVSQEECMFLLCNCVSWTVGWPSTTGTSVPEVLCHNHSSFPKSGAYSCKEEGFYQEANGKWRVGWRSLEFLLTPLVWARGAMVERKQRKEWRSPLMARDWLNVISVGRGILVWNDTFLAKKQQKFAGEGETC